MYSNYPRPWSGRNADSVATAPFAILASLVNPSFMIRIECRRNFGSFYFIEKTKSRQSKRANARYKGHSNPQIPPTWMEGKMKSGFKI